MFVHIAFVRRCASYAWAESAASSRTHTPCTTVRTHRIYLYAYNVYDRTHTTSMTIRIQTQRQSVLPVCTMSCIYRGRECRLRRGRVCCLCARRAAYTEAESAAFAEAECAACVQDELHIQRQRVLPLQRQCAACVHDELHIQRQRVLPLQRQSVLSVCHLCRVRNGPALLYPFAQIQKPYTHRRACTHTHAYTARGFQGGPTQRPLSLHPQPPPQHPQPPVRGSGPRKPQQVLNISQIQIGILL